MLYPTELLTHNAINILPHSKCFVNAYFIKNKKIFYQSNLITYIDKFYKKSVLNLRICCYNMKRFWLGGKVL